MSKSHIATFDIEVYDLDIEDGWRQARYLAHGHDDVLWTDSLNAAMEFIRESCQQATKTLCEGCGIEFKPSRKDQRFCTIKCGSRTRAKRAYERKKRIIEYQKVLSGLRW